MKYILRNFLILIIIYSCHNNTQQNYPKISDATTVEDNRLVGNTLNLIGRKVDTSIVINDFESNLISFNSLLQESVNKYIILDSQSLTRE